MARGSLLSAADVARCPHRVALDRGSAVTSEAPPLATEIRRRIREAATHRDRVIKLLIDAHPTAVVAGGYQATERAAADGAALIVSARLADAGDAQRIAAADLLVRVGELNGRYQYAPVLIKNNEVVDNASARRLREGSITSLLPDDAEWVGGVGVRRNDVMLRNGLVLSHVTRVLETFDLADPRHFGGIIDRHDRLWWFDLDNQDWGRWRLAEYDEAYEQRLEIVRAHERWRAGEGPFPTAPFWHRECPTCPYHERCEQELVARDDVSLVRFTSEIQQVLLREHGVATRVDLARLDPALAAAARGKVIATHDEHEREVHLGRAIDKLDELIYRARSVVSDSALLKVPASELTCPTADVEIDVDMESYNDVTYLWGASVTTRRTIDGVTEGYRSFVSWSELDPHVEATVFAEFWRWFIDQRDRAAAAGATFAAYCFWEQAENSAMNRAVAANLPGGPTRADVEEFRRRTPGEWIDLHEVVKHQIQTDGPLGLKSLARAAGFEWRDENPSGEASMTWYEEAVGDGTEQHATRTRLLEYNEDDCRATKALREWINGAARSLPSRDLRP